MPARRKDYSVAVELYERGFSIGQAAQYFGITRQAMHKILKRRDVVFRPNLRFAEDNHFYRGGGIRKGNANDVLEHALERGDVVRPNECSACGCSGQFTDERTMIQAHHTDYNNPLDVVWLCQKCYHEWHKHNTPIGKDEDVE